MKIETATKLIGPAAMRDYTFDEWKNLTKKEKAQVVNQYWDPFNAKIGFETKSAIINEFRKILNPSGVSQIGIKYFGFYSMQLFVVTDSSKTKIPVEFAGIPVNKGVVGKEARPNIFQIHWRDGGIEDVDLTEKIIVR